MKQIENNLTVLERYLNEGFETTGKTVDKELFPYIRKSMVAFSVSAVQEYKRNRRKEMVKRLKYLPKAFRISYQEFFIQWIRRKFHKRAVKTAQLRANTEHYKIYVVRATTFSYKIFSTREFKFNKKIKVLNKHLTAYDMDNDENVTVIYPK